ncbi:unnamed protein product, partial [Ectocarpus sp. 13 AM-2016]
VWDEEEFDWSEVSYRVLCSSADANTRSNNSGVQDSVDHHQHSVGYATRRERQGTKGTFVTSEMALDQSNRGGSSGKCC